MHDRARDVLQLAVRIFEISPIPIQSERTFVSTTRMLLVTSSGEWCQDCRETDHLLLFFFWPGGIFSHFLCPEGSSQSAGALVHRVRGCTWGGATERSPCPTCTSLLKPLKALQLRGLILSYKLRKAPERALKGLLKALDSGKAT